MKDVAILNLKPFLVRKVIEIFVDNDPQGGSGSFGFFNFIQI